jgi:spore germination protein
VTPVQIFNYADESIGRKEMSFTIMSMMIGIGILTLPRNIASVTRFADGWISILVGGLLAAGFALILAFLAIRMAKDSFYRFASKTITQPLAAALTGLISVYFILFCGFETRAIASISKQYLFERTPVEAVACAFLLVVIYAVSGSRIGLIRLNALFLPLVLVIAVLLLAFSSGNFRVQEMEPFFTTGISGLAAGTRETIFSLLGFEIVLFYGSMLRNRRDALPAAAIGVTVPVLLYLAIYLVCVGVFSQEALHNVAYPAIELAKEAKIPGEFLERFESVFFIIWIMTIYNTTCMALDIACESMRSIFGLTRSPLHPMLLAPFVFWIGMAPRNIAEFTSLGTFVSYLGVAATILMPCIILAVSLLRGVKADG